MISGILKSGSSETPVAIAVAVASPVKVKGISIPSTSAGSVPVYIAPPLPVADVVLM